MTRCLQLGVDGRVILLYAALLVPTKGITAQV